VVCNKVRVGARVVGEEERDRLEEQWNQKFRLGGSGRALGYQDPETRIIRGFTMGEVFAFKPTFNKIGAGRPNDWLVVNTGLWICDFTRPWVEEVCFSVLDAVVKEEDGRFCPKCVPEDWNFSGWCARKGLKVFATTAVPVAHHGRASYRNDQTWGEWETDRGDKAA
jgi:hypothetical protein